VPLAGTATIEIAVGGAVLRVGGDIDLDFCAKSSACEGGTIVISGLE
jgi:hypothetical protein